MFAITRSAAFLSLVLALPGLALAQQRDTIQADTTRWFALQPLVVTISKLPLRAERANFAISVISRRRLDLERPVYAADALRSVSGAFVDESVGAGGPTILRLRGGEEVFTQILMDGVQVNQNGGFFDFQGLPLGNIDHIEVARGPQSAVWGSAAMTGVVNFVSRMGQPGAPRWSMRLERGAATQKSNNYLGNASVAGGSEKLRYSGELGTTFLRGIHAVPHDTRSREAAIRFDALPSNRIDLTLTARATRVEAQSPVRDAGATRAPLDPNARNTRDRYVAALVARHQLSSQWQQQARLANYYEDFLYADQKDNVTSPDFFIFDETFTFSDKLRRTTGEYLISFAPGNRGRVTGGAQIEQEELKEATGGGIGDSSVEFKRNSLAGYGELQLRPTDRIDVLVGGRIEKYDDIDAELTPRGSIGITIVPNRLRVRAATARGFKAPNLQQQYAENPFIDANPDLRAESSVSYEAGADLSVAGGRVEMTATAFAQNFRNLIRTVGQENSTKQINRNLGRSDARGVEWEVRAAATRLLTLVTTGTWLRTRTRDNQGLGDEQYPEGEALPFRPAHTIALSAEWRATNRLSAVVRARTVGEQIALTERFSGRRETVDGYTLFGANLNYAYSSGTTVYLRVDNLFDQKYETAFDQRGMPLTASIGLRIGN